MGRLFDNHCDEVELDRSDLNKCPDCGCFFAQDNCPLCGKPCPEEMRAGNRRPAPKPKKTKDHRREGVRFISWYHQWWVIIVAMVLMPIVGFILLITSPHRRNVKIIVAVVAVLYAVVSFFGVDYISTRVQNLLESPVETSLSEEEYKSQCVSVDSEEFFRNADEYEDEFVTLRVKISSKITDYRGSYYGKKYAGYYVCHAVDSDSFMILVRDCRSGSTRNFIEGDVITIHGEGAGNLSIIDTYLGEFSGAAVNAAYIELVD